MKSAPIGGGGGARALDPARPAASSATDRSAPMAETPVEALGADAAVPGLDDADAEWMRSWFLSLDGGDDAALTDAAGARPSLAATPPKKPVRGVGRAPSDEREDVPYALLSPRSRRKRRNRDQMRLVRRKERETMEKLRATVERLETRYRDMATATNSPISSDEEATQRYAQLISAASRLKDENFRLRYALDDKFKLQETLERVYTDCLASEDAAEAADSHQEAGNADQRVDDDDDGGDAFTPLSSEYVMARVRGTFTQAAAIRELLTRRAAHEHAPFFGWRVRLHSHAHWLMFAFDKPFPQVAALDAMQQMWDRERGMHSYRSASELAHQSMRIVQHVNDDTYVFQRWLCPDSDLLYPSASSSSSSKPVVSTYLRFRLKTPTGFAIGFTSVAPTVAVGGRSSSSSSSSNVSEDGRQEGDDEDEDEDPAHGVWGADLCLWTEFEAVPSAYGREYCVARITGRTNVKNAAFHHRAAADCVIGLLRWESANIGPMFTFAS